MNKRKVQMLKPVEVGEISPVVIYNGKTERLQGFKFTTVYDGIASLNHQNLSRMGLFPGGYGSTWNYVDAGGAKRQTTVEYFFRNGALFPASLERAGVFRTTLQDAVKNFIPCGVSGIGVEYVYDLFNESYVSGYKVTVDYPHAASQNPLFKRFIKCGKPKVAHVLAGATTSQVVYVFKPGAGEYLPQAYNRAIAFKSYVLGQITNKNENIK